MTELDGASWWEVGSCLHLSLSASLQVEVLPIPGPMGGWSCLAFPTGRGRSQPCSITFACCGYPR